MLPKPESIEAGKTYFLTGETLKAILECPRVIKGVESHIGVTTGKDGTVSIGFAYLELHFGIANGELACWAVPVIPQPVPELEA
jgi:hypothetical protein